MKYIKLERNLYDPLFKLKTLMNDLQLACKAYFVPVQNNISFDKRVVAFKGRIRMTTKWGFK